MTRVIPTLGPPRSLWRQSTPYLNSVKKLSGSNKSAHPFFSSRMALHISSPRLNSPIIMSLVECVTLKVEFCWGYAGVMMGIKWYLSAGLTCKWGGGGGGGGRGRIGRKGKHLREREERRREDIPWDSTLEVLNSACHQPWFSDTLV